MRRKAVLLIAAILVTSLGLFGVRPAGAEQAHTGFGGTGVDAYGDAGYFGGPGGSQALSAPAVGMAATPDGRGYWVVAADGGVFTYGDAGFYGSLGALHLAAPIVGMASTPDGGGYWLVALDGGVFTMGDAAFLGSLGAAPPAHSIVGMAVTPGGLGYWLVGSDGAVYPFGDAVSFGSMKGQSLAAPMAAIVRTTDGLGYWLIGSDGGVFTFGDAPFEGSAANMNINTWIVGAAATPDGKGYWLAAATGGVITFGNATFEGPKPNDPPFSPTVAMATTPDGLGYWLLRQDEVVTAFTNPTSSAFPAARQVVSTAATQIGPDPDSSQGSYCNPYGPCEEWCSLFATWVWDQAGFSIPRYAFTGDVWNWAQAHGRVLPAYAVPAPGDGIMYGTGPQNASTSVHMGIVTQVWPDGAVVAIEGDAGPEPAGQYAVVINGPFLPSESQGYNDTPIYGYVQP